MSKAVSFSNEETNAMRLSAGLKPLPVSSKSDTISSVSHRTSASGSRDSIDSGGDSMRQQSEALFQKLKKSRERKGVSLGGQSLGDELAKASAGISVSDWVSKHKHKGDRRKKKKSAIRKRSSLSIGFADIGEDDDDEEDEIYNDAKDATNSKSNSSGEHGSGETGLGAGMRVRHDFDDFKSGSSTVLVLKDKPILGDDMEVETAADELVSVSLLESRKLERRIRRKENPKFRYDAYSSKAQSSLLHQYDDEEAIEKDGFLLDASGKAQLSEEQRAELIKENLRRLRKAEQTTSDVPFTLENYNAGEGMIPSFQSDYQTKEEMSRKKKKSTKKAKFKKRKKKKKSKSEKRKDKTEAVASVSDAKGVGGKRKRTMTESKSSDASSDLKSDLPKTKLPKKKRRSAGKSKTKASDLAEDKYAFLEERVNGYGDDGTAAMAQTGGSDVAEGSEHVDVRTALQREAQREADQMSKRKRYERSVLKAETEMDTTNNATNEDAFEDFTLSFYGDDDAEDNFFVNEALTRARQLEARKSKPETSSIEEIVKAVRSSADANTAATGELVFSETGQFASGLKDAVDERVADERKALERKRQRALRMGDLSAEATSKQFAAGSSMSLALDSAEALELLPLKQRKHQLAAAAAKASAQTAAASGMSQTGISGDGSVVRRQRRREGLWVDSSSLTASAQQIAANGNGNNNNEAGTISSNEDTLSAVGSENGTGKEGVGVFESEPVVSRSLADALRYVSRRGYIEDEPFEGVAGGKTDKFRPADIEMKARKEHLKWDVERVQQWLRGEGLAQYAAAFRRLRVDGSRLDCLSTRQFCLTYKMSDRHCARAMQALGTLKGDPAPDISLGYFDAKGRPKTGKEAFRDLSHIFHGKRPGKKKLEKRLRKEAEQIARRKRGYVDTPLGTLQKLKRTTKESAKPYVQLE